MLEQTVASTFSARAWKVLGPYVWARTQKTSRELSLQAEELRDVAPEMGCSRWPRLKSQNRAVATAETKLLLPVQRLFCLSRWVPKPKEARWAEQPQAQTKKRMGSSL